MRKFRAGRFLFYSSFILTSAIGTGCGKGNPSAASAPQVEAAAQITESFGVAPDPKSGLPVLVIRKDALEKEFLLQAAVIEQAVAPMGQGLKSRIVVFKRHGNQLFLLEATQGHTVTNDLPQQLVLTAFAIDSETPDTLQFDFNTGMKNIFASGEWTGQDMAGREYSPAISIAKTRLAFLDEVKFAPPNRLLIRQIAQIEASSLFGGEAAPTVEVRYFLSPYRPTADFEPGKDADFKRAGFFEISPQLQLDGSTLVRPTKFNSKKPIVFAVSSNTPAEYKQALRDGILYWKGVLPQIEANDAPAGVSAPDIDHNIIQWVNYDTAGMAYADAQADPRTGEVLHGQAFITSTFAFGSRQQVRSLIRKLDSKPVKAATRVTLAGFNARPLCAMDHRREFSRALGEVLATNSTDANILRVSQDYVRAVVAHEVGHILGLRHNYAGSLSVKNYPLEKREAIFQEYLRNDTVPMGIETSSSEMDYLPLEESAIHGQQMRTNPGSVYPHDRAALEMLYFGKDPKLADVPAFCTDTHLSKYTDCKQFDAGPSLIEFSSASSRRNLQRLPNKIVESYIAAKAPPLGLASRAVAEVGFDTEAVAQSIVGPIEALVKGFASTKNSVQIARLFPFITTLNEEEVMQEETNSIEAEVKRLGGWDNVLNPIVAKDYEKIFDATDALLKDPNYLSGVGLGGQTYEFDQDEVEIMLETTMELAVKLPEKLTKLYLSILPSFPASWKDSSKTIGQDMAALFDKRSREYLFTTRSSKVIEAEIEVPAAATPASLISATLSSTLKSVLPGNQASSAPPAPAAPATRKVTVKLPEFFYTQEIREKAASLLKAPLTGNVDWGFEQRVALRADFKKLLNDSCGCEFSNTHADKLNVGDNEVRARVTKWFLENKRVLSSFP